MVLTDFVFQEAPINLQYVGRSVSGLSVFWYIDLAIRHICLPVDPSVSMPIIVSVFSLSDSLSVGEVLANE